MKTNKYYFKFKNGQSYYLPSYSTVSGRVFGYFINGYRFWFLFQFLLVGFYICYLINLYVSHNGPLSYFRANQIKKSIIANWLKTKGAEASSVQVLVIDAVCNRDATLSNMISKLAGMFDNWLDNLIQLVNSSLVGKWKNYTVISQLIADNGFSFSFIAENTGINQAFTPKCEEDLRQEPYFVMLQNNLTINLTKSRIVSENLAVLKLLSTVCEKVMPKRQKFVANQVKQKQ